MKLFVLALLLAAMDLQAQDRPVDRVSSQTLLLITGADLGTTWYGIAKDHRQEANPLLKGTVIAQSSAVIGVTVAADFMCSYLSRRGHPKLAAAFRFGISGSHIYAIQMNLR